MIVLCAEYTHVPFSSASIMSTVRCGPENERAPCSYLEVIPRRIGRMWAWFVTSSVCDATLPSDREAWPPYRGSIIDRLEGLGSQQAS